MCHQRLPSEIRWLRQKIQKMALQRRRGMSLSLGKLGTILSAGTWPTETGLAGWGGRTRTCKRFTPTRMMWSDTLSLAVTCRSARGRCRENIGYASQVNVEVFESALFRDWRELKGQ
jgi:hypothetical protein